MFDIDLNQIKKQKNLIIDFIQSNIILGIFSLCVCVCFQMSISKIFFKKKSIFQCHSFFDFERFFKHTLNFHMRHISFWHFCFPNTSMVKLILSKYLSNNNIQYDDIWYNYTTHMIYLDILLNNNNHNITDEWKTSFHTNQRSK